ncbi:MAG: DPP IV N-terminal domain-containing protein [Chitinophagaceae bacterium]|nr:DPP IV N-terminal domain-containing protein [Chitinophagaceae bacterium]
MLKKLLFTFLCLGVVSAYAQKPHKKAPKANYELASKYSPAKLRKMVFSTSVNPNWLKSGKFWYSYSDTKSQKWYIVDPVRRTKTPLFDNADLARKLSVITWDPHDAAHLGITSIKFADDERSFTFKVASKKDTVKTAEERKNLRNKADTMKKKTYTLKYDLATGNITEIEDTTKPEPGWASFTPDSSAVIYAKNYNLYWMDRENYEKIKKDDKDSTVVEHELTKGGVIYYAWGGDGYSMDDTTNLERLSKEKKRVRLLWSPDGRYFVTTRKDNRDLRELWVINSTGGKRPILETYKYQMPGEPDSTEIEMHLFDFKNKTSKQIDVGRFKNQRVSFWSAPVSKTESGGGFGGFGGGGAKASHWYGENDYFYAQRTSRDQKKIDLLRVHTDGKVDVLIEERSNVYLDIQRPQILGHGNEIVFWSERDGWGQLYLFDGNGKLKNQITKGEFFVSRVEYVDEKARKVYFTANGKEENEDPYYNHLYSINLDGTGMKLLNKGDYDHRASTNDHSTFFVDNYSRVNTVPKSALYNQEGVKIMDLEEADLSNLFATGYKFPEPFKVKADDGITDLYGVMYKPYDFDSTKMYPLIEYVYPGPQTEAVNKTFSTGMDHTDRLAQLGFIVITVGNRGGHPNRSKWYHTYSYGNLRDYGLADKKAAAEQIADRYSFIDRDRIGINGHSGGGFMSAAAMFVYPDFFKVAVSESGNHDNNIYNRNWSERHHGVQEKISAKGDTTFAYTIEKNSEIAKNLKGHLLLVTGDIDNNVHPAGTIRVANALIKANKRFDFLLLPGERHGFGSSSEYFFWKMADYFTEYLLGDTRGRRDVDMMEINREIPKTK